MKRSPPVASIGSVRGGPPGITWVAAGAQGLLRVQLGGTKEELLADLARSGIALERGMGWEAEALDQIASYLRGRSLCFSLPLWMEGLSDFSVRVYRTLQAVPFGSVVTYGELAARVGSAGGARAVGRAMGKNPLPLVVPCHRVVAAGGALGGFSGGLALKRALLRLEGQLSGS